MSSLNQGWDRVAEALLHIHGVILPSVEQEKDFLPYTGGKTPLARVDQLPQRGAVFNPLAN